MFTFVIRRLFYGLTVLFGVLSLVFLLFTMVPDPARELAGQSESEELVAAIRAKLNLDLPAGKRYLLFLNDLSPISRHSQDPAGRSYHEAGSLVGVKFIETPSHYWILKRPYLGRSWLSSRSVGSILGDALPGTFVLALIAMAFALMGGLLLGSYAALNKDGSVDRMLVFVTAIGMSGPSFFMAILIAWLFGYVWHDYLSFSAWLLIVPFLFLVLRRLLKRKFHFGLWPFLLSIGLGGLLAWWSMDSAFIPHFGLRLPGTGLPMNGSMFKVDVWEGVRLAPEHFILPALTLGIRPLAVISQLMRNSVLEVMGMPYVRTAFAKGLSRSRVMLRHVLRNALNPVITAASGWLASMLAGAVFVEFVFGWKGLGMEVFRSLEKNDLPVVMGAVMVIAAIFVVVNTLVDLLYQWVDPRVRVR